MGVPVFIVAGNHERSRIPVTLLEKLPNIFTFDRPVIFTKTVKLFKIAMAGFPCIRENSQNYFQPRSKKPTEKKFNLYKNNLYINDEIFIIRPDAKNRTECGVIMNIFIDGHVHLYEHYDLELLFKTALKNFQKNGAGKNDAKILLLTELASCDFFNQIEQKKPNGFTLHETSENNSLLLTETETQNGLFIIAGRQLTSSDQLEILALCTRYNIENNRLDTKSLIDQVNARKAVPVLNWAPGKWFSKRGGIVKKMLSDFTAEELLIGDTTMRPTFWPTPRLMKQALDSNFKIIAGSDPLPLENEEKMIASYGFLLNADFEKSTPASSLYTLLKNPKVPVKIWGRRSNGFSFFRRQTGILLKKYTRSTE